MKLNLPFYDRLADCERILVAGAGGGFDVFAGLPIYHDLCQAGRTVYLANYSFTDLPSARCVSGGQESPAVFSFKGRVVDCPKRKGEDYFPEGYLAEFMDLRGMTSQVYAFPKVGVKPIREAYRYLCQALNIDAIILIDGGVDSIMRGDEKGCATILEDSVSLAALRDVDVKKKYLACVGFGTEIDDGLCHYRALENIANLMKHGGYLGSCGLTPEMAGFHLMRDAYRYVIRAKPSHPGSHITPRIIAAVEGMCEVGKSSSSGEEGWKVNYFLNPLMTQYWFFEPGTVASFNKLINATFCQTVSWTDVMMVHRQTLEGMRLRPDQIIPL